MINRNNYELWFLDFIEGNLPENKIESLYTFLEKNPDLKEEFQDVNMVYLNKEELIFDKKHLLKQNVDIEIINGLNSFEVLAIKELEGEISETEKRELNSLIQFSNDLQMEAEIFRKTKLKADSSLVYIDKDKLIKRKIVPLWIKYISSIAAIGILLLFVRNVFNKDFGTSKSVVKTRVNVIQTNKTNNNKVINNTKSENTTTIVSAHKPQVKVYTIKPKNDIIFTPKKNNIIKTNTINSLVLSENKKMLRSYNNLAMMVSLPKINRDYTSLINYTLPTLTKLTRIENRDYIVNTDIPHIEEEPLTPKQFIIKTVKRKLKIDDNNYNSVNAINLVSLAMKKAKIGSLDIKKSTDAGKKYLALNIGGFRIERSWNSN